MKSVKNVNQQILNNARRFGLDNLDKAKAGFEKISSINNIPVIYKKPKNNNKNLGSPGEVKEKNLPGKQKISISYQRKEGRQMEKTKSYLGNENELKHPMASKKEELVEQDVEKQNTALNAPSPNVQKNKNELNFPEISENKIEAKEEGKVSQNNLSGKVEQDIWFDGEFEIIKTQTRDIKETLDVESDTVILKLENTQ